MNCRILSLAALLLLTPALRGEHADSPFGVCAHLNRMPQQETVGELDGIVDTGIGYVRTALDWAQVEPRPGEWDFSRWDEVVEAAAARGVKVLPILGGELPAHGKPPFANLDRWLAFVEQCVRRYQGRIDCYEVINEADCDRPWGAKPNPEQYTALLKATYERIKTVDPQAKVLFTGVSDFGEPMKFVERAFAAGAGHYFDVMNFHPYQWRNTPESQLPLRLQDLRNLMTRYQINKPIWITEIGNSSAPDQFILARAVVPAALRRLGFTPGRDTVGFLADDRTLYYTGGLDAYLPEWQLRRALSFDELRTVPVTECPIVALPGQEGFPAAEFDAVESYVRRGGTLILPGGFPFYFDFQASESAGLFRSRQINAELLPRIHLGWEAFWVNQAVPRTTTAFAPGELFPELAKVAHRPSMRFLSDQNLKGNDRLEALGYGVNGEFRLPVAALYRLDSDLKGNIVITVDDGGTDSVSETEQAERLPREYLTALGSGADKVFNYRFRAGEWNRGREAHFGIVRRNFEAKPAQRAYATLIRLCPPGSTRPTYRVEDGIHRAEWTRTDGKRVTALWTTFRHRSLPLPDGFSGSVISLEGAPVTPVDGKVTLSPAVIYLAE